MYVQRVAQPTPGMLGLGLSLALRTGNSGLGTVGLGLGSLGLGLGTQGLGLAIYWP